MTTREEMIQTVAKIIRGPISYAPYIGKSLTDYSREVVDALYPRQRNSVPLPDGGRMEWHEGAKEPWVHFLGDVGWRYSSLSSHNLPDDLHAECFALKNREWVEDEAQEKKMGAATTLREFAEVDAKIAALKERTPAPTNATPIGFMNRSKYGIFSWHETKEAAAKVAYWNMNTIIEVALPVYRHAQTEAELIAALEGCGWCYEHHEQEDNIPEQYIFVKPITKRAGGGK